LPAQVSSTRQDEVSTVLRPSPRADTDHSSLLDSLRQSTSASRRVGGDVRSSGRKSLAEASRVSKACRALCSKLSAEGVPPSQEFYQGILKDVELVATLVEFSCRRAEEIDDKFTKADAKMSLLESEVLRLQVAEYTATQRARATDRQLDLERQKAKRLSSQVEETSAELEQEKKLSADLRLELADLRSRLEGLSSQDQPAAALNDAPQASHDEGMLAKLEDVSVKVSNIERMMTASSARNSFLGGTESFLGEAEGPSMLGGTFSGTASLPPKPVMGQVPGPHGPVPQDDSPVQDPVGQEESAFVDKKFDEFSSVLADYKRRLVDNLRSKVAENASLTQKLRETVADRDGLAARLKEAEAALAEASQRSAQLSSQLRAEKGRADDLQAQVESDVEAMRGQEAAIAALQGQRAKLQADLEEARVLHGQAAETIEGLQERAKGLQEDVEQAERRLHEEQEARAAQTSERRRAEEALEVEKARSCDLQNQIRQKKEEVEEATRQLQEKEDAASAAQDAMQAEKRKLAESTRSLAAGMLREMASMKQACASIGEDVTGLLRQFGIKQDEILSALSKLASVHSGERQRVSKIMEDLKEQLGSLGTTVELLGRA